MLGEKDEYRFHIVSVPIIPPLPGGQRFAGQILELQRRNTDGSFERVSPPFSECWGDTASEAEERACDAIEEWIEQRGGARYADDE